MQAFTENQLNLNPFEVHTSLSNLIGEEITVTIDMSLQIQWLRTMKLVDGKSESQLVLSINGYWFHKTDLRDPNLNSKQSLWKCSRAAASKWRKTLRVFVVMIHLLSFQQTNVPQKRS